MRVSGLSLVVASVLVLSGLGVASAHARAHLSDSAAEGLEILAGVVDDISWVRTTPSRTRFVAEDAPPSPDALTVPIIYPAPEIDPAERAETQANRAVTPAS